MFIKIIAGCLLLLTVFTTSTFSQVVRIPDENFKRAIIGEGVDTNGDGQIQVEEAKKVTVLYVGKAGIVSLEGIKSFTNLVDFGCYQNKVKEVDVSGMKKLKFIYGFDGEIEVLKVKGCDSLRNISCHSNKLRSLDLAGLNNLIVLSVGFNQLTKLDVSNHPNLKQVQAHTNSIREFKFNNCPEMLDIWIDRNEISHHLDFTRMPKLKNIKAIKNPIPSIDVRGLAMLEELKCYETYITTLSLAGTVKLEDLSWY